MRTLIAGAGVGGLTAALSLHAAGFTGVRIVETAPAIRAIGVGLNILPNAVRELTELGLDRSLAKHAISTVDLRFFHRSGKLIWQEPRGLAAGYRWPQLALHHEHLLTVLAHAVHARLGADSIRTGIRVLDCSSRSSGEVEVTLEHVDTGLREIDTVDLLIGADGIHSAVRASLYPAEGSPSIGHMVMWRGTSWAGRFLTGKSMIVVGTDTERIVLYPIDIDRGGTRCLINWVAACPADPTCQSERPEHADVAGVLDRFGDWCFDWVDIPAIFAAVEHVYRYRMVDRDPLPRWTFGGVTLLGDAAHAMYPMGSNGATQSILDARVLANTLATASDIPEALARYESERRPAMTELQASNRKQGPETVIAMVHQRAPHGFDDVHEVISEHEIAAIETDYAAAAGLDVEFVNTRPSLSPPHSSRR